MKKEEMAQMMSSLSSSSSCICLCMKNHSFPGLPVRQLFVSGELKTCLATTKLRASVDDIANDTSSSPLVQHQDHPNQEVVESIKVLKNAAKTRKVDKNKVLSALSVIEKAKLDPSKFLEMLGGAKSPGRTWMLIFTAENNLNGGRYFPLTAVQRFDAEAKRIENGVYLGPLGSLSFEGRLSWKNRILAFIFECVRIKVGPFNPLQISLGNQDNREPNNKDPSSYGFISMRR